MKLYYYTQTSDEIQKILREGFIDNLKYKGINCVYLGEAPSAESDDPGEQLLEVTFPPEIGVSQFELFAPGVSYREFCVPADIINKYGKIRQLTGGERKRRHGEWHHEDTVKTFKQLLTAGVVEIATQRDGRTIYRNGKTVYRITEKGRKVVAIFRREGGTGVDLMRIAKTISNKPKLDGSDRRL